MAVEILRTDYFYTTVRDRPGEAFLVLRELAAGEVNLRAFNAVPLGPSGVQLTLFPRSPERLAAVAERIGLVLDGPHAALLVQGDDRLGALADIHTCLAEAGVPVFSSTGVTSGPRGFGYVIYVNPSEIDRATGALHKLH
jgi:hypothetical protein